MVRSLWSAATGMIAQQTAVDTIANNISNVNTAGYKTSQNEFKSLLYQELQTRTTTANGDTKPIDSQVGLGVRPSSITTIFRQGNFYAAEGNNNFAINGAGFFAIRGEDGNTYYTRNGNFTIARGNNNRLVLSTSNGEQVLDSQGNQIVFPENVSGSQIIATADGEFGMNDETGNFRSFNIRIGLYQFNNPEGLEKMDGSRYKQTVSSGNAINEATNNNIEKSSVRQGFLEGSNVQLADEMVNLIVAQRAYEANSKAITTSDTMMEQANQLKR